MNLPVWLENFNKKYKKGLYELATHQLIPIGKKLLHKHKEAFKELAEK